MHAIALAPDKPALEASYMTQLDALRAFAVTPVMIHHCIPGGWAFGAYSGVKLFFTLSGFLITGILLKARAATGDETSRRFSALGRFYARRVLRIFPLYYFVVAVALVVNLRPARKLAAWLLTYTLNIHMAWQGWYEDNFAHFWSLSVEEQFYMFWPWLILFVRRRFLLQLILVAILVGPLYRLSYVLSGYQNMTPLSTYISTLTSLDNLALGALLALLVERYPHSDGLKKLILRIALPLALVAAALVDVWGSTNAKILFRDLLYALVFCSLIFGASIGFGGRSGRFLQWRPLRYLGKISYGLYVYHPLILGLSTFLVGLAGASLARFDLARRIFAALLTLVVASLSWRLMERPLNDLKRYF
jgi:peptidoglycan/LPS O-acetylase OafA/YrhL